MIFKKPRGRDDVRVQVRTAVIDFVTEYWFNCYSEPAMLVQQERLETESYY